MRLIVYFLFLTFIIALPDTLFWEPLPNSSVSCSYTAGVYLANKYYQVCGSQGINGDYKYMQIYNGSSWAQSTTMHPYGVSGHSTAIWNGKIIISGGLSASSPSGYYNSTSIYDSNGSTSWLPSTPMPISSFIYTAMASYNNKCYLFGGSQMFSTYYNTVFQWTPGDSSMILKANMPDNRCGLAVAECNGIIYAFGGKAEPSSWTNTIWAFNPASNNWTVKQAHLSTARAFASAVAIGEKIYIIGGSNQYNSYSTVEIYDTNNDTITTTTSLPLTTASHASAGYITENSNTSYTGHLFVSGGSLGTGAYLGTVTGVYCNKVQPTSLGNLKALYH
jgi:N-acetylneuraminic acid mutarotase